MAAHDDKEAEARKKEREKVEKFRRTQVTRAMQKVLNDPDGRQLLWHLLQVGRWGTMPFNSDPLKMAFNCGELNVGAQIMDLLLEANPEGFLILQMEQRNDGSIDPNSGTSERAGAVVGTDYDPFDGR